MIVQRNPLQMSRLAYVRNSRLLLVSSHKRGDLPALALRQSPLLLMPQATLDLAGLP
jgi:hypothetical protein